MAVVAAPQRLAREERRLDTGDNVDAGFGMKNSGGVEVSGGGLGRGNKARVRVGDGGRRSCAMAPANQRGAAEFAGTSVLDGLGRAPCGTAGTRWEVEERGTGGRFRVVEGGGWRRPDMENEAWLGGGRWRLGARVRQARRVTSFI